VKDIGEWTTDKKSNIYPIMTVEEEAPTLAIAITPKLEGLTLRVSKQQYPTEDDLFKYVESIKATGFSLDWFEEEGDSWQVVGDLIGPDEDVEFPRTASLLSQMEGQGVEVIDYELTVS
jgi:hypothetical protein